jgi:hypothetical protein
MSAKKHGLAQDRKVSGQLTMAFPAFFVPLWKKAFNSFKGGKAEKKDAFIRAMATTAGRNTK